MSADNRSAMFTGGCICGAVRFSCPVADDDPDYRALLEKTGWRPPR